MSLFPSLKASSSRQARTLSLPRSAFPLHRRYASNKPKEQGSIQAAEKQLAEQQRQSRMMPGLDMASIATPVLEPIIDPPAQWTWLYQGGLRPKWNYTKVRFTRFRTTIASLSEIIKRKGIETVRAKHVGAAVVQFFAGFKPSRVADLMMKDAYRQYQVYNQAQASGDVATLRSVATASALSSALAIQKNPAAMKWELISENRKPKIISARLAPISANGSIVTGQIVLRFDTDQALTVTPRGKASKTTTRRVVDHYVFERILPGGPGWKLKQRLDVTPPPFLQIEAASADNKGESK
ncbi:hypothetical protein P7C73_g6317, partial [Tremellales sp. Uapishka_1]